MIDLSLLFRRRTVSLTMVPPARGTRKMRRAMVKWIKNVHWRRAGQAMAEDVHRISARSGFARRFFQAD